MEFRLLRISFFYSLTHDSQPVHGVAVGVDMRTHHFIWMLSSCTFLCVCVHSHLIANASTIHKDAFSSTTHEDAFFLLRIVVCAQFYQQHLPVILCACVRIASVYFKLLLHYDMLLLLMWFYAISELRVPVCLRAFRLMIKFSFSAER